MPTEFPPTRRKRRTLNVTALKQVAVFTTALITGFGSAVTGLGAQLAFAPMLSWMLGYKEAKAAGLAFSFALTVSLATVIGALAFQFALFRDLLYGVPPFQYALWQALLYGVPLFIGMTLGALVGVKFSAFSKRDGANRLFLSIAIMGMLFVILQVARENILTPAYGVRGIPILLYLILGLAAGGVSQATKIPSGILLIPGLYYLIGLKAIPAIATAHVVVGLAALLPAIAASRTQTKDPVYAFPVTLAACLSGLAGGWLLVRYGNNEGNKWMLYAFAAVGMFLCGRELATQSDKPPTSGIDSVASESDTKSGE